MTIPDAPAHAHSLALTASRCWFQASARTRIVLHLGTEMHFVLLEFEHVTSIHASDRQGAIGSDWFGVVVEPTFDRAIQSFASARGLSPEQLADLVAPYRTVAQAQPSVEDAPSAHTAPPYGPVAPTGPTIQMGGSSCTIEPRNPGAPKGKVVTFTPSLACANGSDGTWPL